MINDRTLTSQALSNRGRDENHDPFGWIDHPFQYIITDDLGKNYLSIFLYDVEGLFTSSNRKHLSQDSGYSDFGRTSTEASLFVTLQVLHFGETLTPVIQSCASLPKPLNLSSRALVSLGSANSGCFEEESLLPEQVAPDARAGLQLLNEWLVFPLRLCDLPLDAVVECRVYASEGGACLATTHFDPFDLFGELRTGRLVCELRSPHRTEPTKEFCDLSPETVDCHSEWPYQVELDDAPTSLSSLVDRDHVREMFLHAQNRGMFPSISWLDRITEKFLHHEVPFSSLPEAYDKVGTTSPSATSGQAHVKAYLRLYLPPPTERIPILIQHTSDGLLDSKDLKMHYSSDVLLSAYAADSNIEYVDHCYLFKNHNVCEVMAAIQARSLYLLYDTTAAPALRERQRLMELASQPPIRLDPPRIEDVALLWKYCHFVCKDSRFFVIFLRGIDWSQPHSAESRVAKDLILKWKSVGLAEILSCLSRLFSGVAPVRQFAVQLLSREADAKLCWLSVFLIQALRYESKRKELTQFLIGRSVRNWELCSALYWGSYVEALLEGDVYQASEAAQQSYIIAFFHQLEKTLREGHPFFMHRLQSQRRLINSLRELCSTLQQTPIDRPGKIDLGRRLLAKKACGFEGVFSQLSRIEAVYKSSETTPLVRVHKGDSSGDEGVLCGPLDIAGATVTLPCHPCIVLDGICSSGFSIFKSSKLPVQVVFHLAPPVTEPYPTHSLLHSEDHLVASRSSCVREGCPPCSDLLSIPIAETEKLVQKDVATKKSPATIDNSQDILTKLHPVCAFRPLAFDILLERSGIITHSISKLPMMFKLNDDVRQDQLVLHLIYWVDSLLRQDGLDLCLTPYRVVATRPNEGLIEVVLNAVTFQSIQRDALKYLRQHNPTPAKMLEAMDRYKRSFAGYCVITFVLGIGDRHLENILLTQDGRLFHIDFGYILGNDPKPFPPPMKISPEMIDVLGGPQSPGYAEFKSYCCSAYNILRKHAVLFLTMLQLMVHARSLPQITGNGSLDPSLILLQVQDKLRLDLSNAQAAQYLLTMIADSVGSIFTGLWDVLHVAAQATRM